MRLRSLRLERYGHFAGATLGFDPAPGTINIVEAPNGAGKSVVRQAILELLFGYRGNTPMNFRYDYPQLELRAEAVLPDGGTCEFIRRKRATNPLTELSGKPASIRLLQAMPREGERKRLERLFVLDSAQLRAGGSALLQTDGDLADALLASAGELGSSRTVARALAAQRDEDAPSRRRAGAPFYVACEAWAAANAKLTETLVRPAEVADQERQRAEAAGTLRAAKEQAAEAARALDQVNRVQRCRGHLRQMDEANEWLASHADAPAMPPGLAERLREAKDAAGDAAREAETARKSHEALTAQAASAEVDEAVLANADAIGDLAGRREQSKQSQADLPGQQHVVAKAQAEIARLLRALGSSADPAHAVGEVRATADIEAARALVAEAAEVGEAQTQAAAAMHAQRAALAELEDSLAALPAAVALESLRAAADEAAADGDPMLRLRDAGAQADRAAGECAAALAGVPGWIGPAEALAALAVPAEATLLRLDKAQADARNAAKEAGERRAGCEAGLQEAERRLAAVTGAEPLPDMAALAGLRRHRDRGWQLVLTRLSGAPDAAAEAAYAPTALLPLAFEKAIADADAVADRRAAEMERIAKAEGIRGEIARAQAAAAGLAQQAGHAAVAAARADADWAGAVQPLGLPPAAGLAEASAFLAGRSAALAAIGKSRAAGAALEALRARQAGWADELAAALDSKPDTLPRLAAVARARLAKAEADAVERRSLLRRQIELRRKVAEAAPTLEEADARKAGWSRRWSAALHRLRRPADEAAAVTAAVLDQLVALAGAVDAAGTAEGRVSLMQLQLDTFARDAARLAASLGGGGGDPLAIARRLDERLTAARTASGTRSSLAKQAEQAAQACREAGARHADALDALAGAIRAVGAATLQEAERQVQLAADRAQWEGMAADAVRGLREDGDGLDPDSLRAEAAQHPAAGIQQAKRDADAHAAAAQGAVADAAARIALAEAELRRLTASEGASHAAVAREAAAARLSSLLDEALVQHLAAAMLDSALAEVEAAGGDNKRLARIGATFATLTAGAYDRLSPAGDDKEGESHGRLLAHEAGGAEKHIARLSEGTRDQLYLALRLVAIEDHVAAAPALPFIADDILQTFDDTRARAALEALVGLSRHVQVIVLTHHPHLLALARGLPVHAQTLPATAAAPHASEPAEVGR